MATNNRNRDDQSQSSNQDWDRDRDRSNQNDDYRNRDQYNRYQQSGGMSNQHEGMRGNYGSSSMDYSRGMDDESRYRHQSGGYSNDRSYGQQYGGMNSGNNWQNSGSYGNNDRDNDRSRHQRQNSGSNWGGNDRSNQNMGYGGSPGAQYGSSFNDNRYNTSGGYGSDSNRSNYGGGYTGAGGYISSQGQHRGDMDRDYNSNREQFNNTGDHDRDRNWWDRTKDEVSSWFDSDDNNDRNRNSGPHRGKGPKDYKRSDDRIREDVCDRLSDDSRVDASDINVQIQNNEVVLTGTVNSKEEKRRAEDLVESISGVRNVENRLRVGRHDDTGSSSMSSSTRTSGTDASERNKNR